MLVGVTLPTITSFPVYDYCDVLSAMSVLVQVSQLDELVSKLKKDIPKSLPVLGTIQHIILGKLEGKVFTNGWPEFTAVICQHDGVIFQSVLSCYAKGCEDLLNLLEGAKLTAVGQEWLLWVNTAIGDELIESIKLRDDDKEILRFKTIHLLYLPDAAAAVGKSQILCPTGFKLRKLEEKHCELIAPYWIGIDDLQAKETLLKVLIKKFHSVGLFAEEDPNTPIAWCVQYPNGRPGHLYVTEPYRRRGFATLVMKHMCRCILEDGLIPGVAVQNQIAKDLMEKMGFVEMDKYYILKKV